MKISKCFGGMQLVIATLFVAGICVSFSVANAMPSEEEKEALRIKMESMTDEEKADFMNKRKAEMNGAKDSEGIEKNENSVFRDDGTEEILDEHLEERINKARRIFNRNQFRLRVARNVATSTVAQMQLEGTDVESLREHLQTLEGKMAEIEGIYGGYLNEIVLFRNKRGSDPGDPSEIFSSARTKKTELVEFYKNTFRSSFEEALIQNEKEKAE